MASSDPIEIKCIIRSLLTSNPLRCTIKQLCNDFHKTVGYNIPLRQLGFNNPEDYLRSIPDTVAIYGTGPFAEVEGIVSQQSAHINEMVVKQKKNVPKHKRGQIRFVPKRQPLFSNYNYPPSPVFTHSDPSTSMFTSSYSPTPIFTNSNPQPPALCNSNPTSSHMSHTSLLETLPSPSPHVQEQPISPSKEYCDKGYKGTLGVDYGSSIEDDDYQSKIPPRVQNNLRKLILQFPDGIWCTRLPTEYNKMFKRKLCYEDYGYRSLIEMCSDLPEVFKYVQPTSDDFILYDKNKPIPCLDQNKTSTLPVTENIATTTIWNDIPQLNWGMGPPLIPTDVLHPGDRIARYALEDDFKVGEYLDISIGEIYDISKFWMYLTFGKLKGLMNELQAFFHNDRNKYLMPEALYEEGLYCVCLYAGEFHRAVIVNLVPKLKGFIRVLFVDYGTVGNVPSNEIWYLPQQFSYIPYQAIRGRLSNIYPVYENRPWSIQAINRFRELITNTALIAEITRISKEDNFIEIYLADVTDENNIFYINDVLVKEELALYADEDRKPSLTDPYCMPNVEYIHLFPEFYEIEAGYAPTTPEMNYIIANKIPMHYYIPQYFNIVYEEDVAYIQEQHKKFNKVVPNFKIKPAPVQNDFDFSFFPPELQDDIRELVKQDEERKAKSRSEQNKTLIQTVPKVEVSDELIYGHKDKASDSQVQLDSPSSKSDNYHLKLSPDQLVSIKSDLKRLSLNNSDMSVIHTTPKSNNSTNPFLSEDCVSDPNPFRSTTPGGSNPFLSTIEDLNTTDLLEIFSKSSEEKLPEKIVNNLNPSPPPPSSCKCTVKQVNVDKPKVVENINVNGASACNSPEKKTSNQTPEVNRRVRTPPGFRSAHQGAPMASNTWNQTYYNPPNNFLNNPYYHTFPHTQFNNSFGIPNQFGVPLGFNAGMYPPYFNFVPPMYPSQLELNLQFLQQALAAQNFQPQEPPRRNSNYGPPRQ